MPPPPSQSKKIGPGPMRQQPRSRNTTPIAAVNPTAGLPPSESVETETVDLRFDVFRNITYEDMVDSGTASTVLPESKGLDGILSRLEKLKAIIGKREETCDRSMRFLSQNRRLRIDELAAERGREEERRLREADDERKANKKKRKATETLAPLNTKTEHSSPLRDNSSKPRKFSRDNDSASSSLSPIAPRTPSNMDADDKTKVEENDEPSSEEGRPPPPARPQANTFGDDPSTFPDPTVYEIRQVKACMSEEEIKEIYSVASYPKSDLADLIAGDPPDKDFSSAKPSNQINFSTFNTYIEPYFRPFNEEDVAFLRERGNRVESFVIPRRGRRHYTEIWAEEDGAMAIDSASSRDQLPQNQPRGSIENMDDDVAETDKLSAGPLYSRFMSTLRLEQRVRAETANGTNGDDSTNGIATFDFSFSDGQAPAVMPANGGSSQMNAVGGATSTGAGASGENALPPATHMPESNSELWRKGIHARVDYMQAEDRLRQELRFAGLLPAGSDANAGSAPDSALTADYDGHFDDEIAARMRLLQARLREQVLLNGARKARLTDLVKERMAHQEYQTILEDLDSQVAAAYLKRTRTMGKKLKKSRPGTSNLPPTGATGPGMARPGIGDMAKTVMERRRRWIDSIGTVFDDENVTRVPRASDPNSTIFKPADMAALVEREKELWDEEVEEE